EHHRGQFEQRLRKLAEQWHPGDAARAQEAERALRVELQRAWNSPARTAQPVRPDEFDTDEAAGAAAPARRMSGEILAEALLLRAALSEGEWAARIAAELGTEGFEDPAHRSVAAALFGDTGEWRDR